MILRVSHQERLSSSRRKILVTLVNTGLFEVVVAKWLQNDCHYEKEYIRQYKKSALEEMDDSL